MHTLQKKRGREKRKDIKKEFELQLDNTKHSDENGNGVHQYNLLTFYRKKCTNICDYHFSISCYGKSQLSFCSIVREIKPGSTFRVTDSTKDSCLNFGVWGWKANYGGQGLEKRPMTGQVWEQGWRRTKPFFKC